VDGSDEEDPDAQRIIRESVDGKALAVDLSLWILQACTQPALDEVFNEDLGFDDPDASKTAKIVFDRALNYLRHGCVPVGVIDGQAPWEKLGALRARWGAQCTGGGGGAFGRCSDVALTVLRALGLPGVEAPGEAEATCAAMDRLDIVDGCVTSDGDSLLFGARTVFKTLKLSAANQKDLAMERVDAADLATRLMLGDKVEHVAPALTALALLTGGRLRLAGCAERGRHQGAVSGQGAGQERGGSAPTRGKGRRAPAGPDVTRAPRRLPRVSSGPEHRVPG
jgi:flap endonuclease GEN